MIINYINLTNELSTSGQDSIPITVNSVVIHHFGYQSTKDTPTQIRDVNKVYIAKNQVFPYTFVIGREEDDIIYITGFVDMSSWHCSNIYANQDSIPVSFVGNYEVDAPTGRQIEKLHQLLLDIKNGEIIGGFNPFEKTSINYGGVIIPSRTTWHNQVALPGNPTACCGKNLIPFIQKIQEVGEAVISPAPIPKPVEIIPTPVIPDRTAELQATINSLTSQLDATRLEYSTNLFENQKRVTELEMAVKLLTEDAKARAEEIEKASILAQQIQADKEALEQKLNQQKEMSPLVKSLIGLIGKGGMITIPSIYLAITSGLSQQELVYLTERYQYHIILIGFVYLALRWLKEAGAFDVAETDLSFSSKLSRAFKNLI